MLEAEIDEPFLAIELVVCGVDVFEIKIENLGINGFKFCLAIAMHVTKSLFCVFLLVEISLDFSGVVWAQNIGIVLLFK